MCCKCVCSRCAALALEGGPQVVQLRAWIMCVLSRGYYTSAVHMVVMVSDDGSEHGWPLVMRGAVQSAEAGVGLCLLVVYSDWWLPHVPQT
jgi:hypothetical protein